MANSPSSVGFAAPPIRLVLFDLDGTLIDSLPDLRQSLNFVRRLFRLPPLSSGQVQSFVGDGAWRLIERSLPGLSREEQESGYSLFRNHYHDHCADFTTLYPGCRETLQNLRLRGKTLGIITNKPDTMAQRILDSFRVSDLIHILIGGDRAQEKKPSPVPLRQALREAGCLGDEALMVGDSANDIDAARGAAIRSCGVSYGFSLAAASDGSPPDFTVHRLPDLLSLVH